MKTVGLILLIGGLSFGLFALNMDTSVKVSYPLGNLFNLPERVNNLGLMNDRQNYLIFSGIISILGAMIFFSKSSSKELATLKTNGANYGNSNTGNLVLNPDTETRKILFQLSQLLELKEKNVITEEIYEQESISLLDKFKELESSNPNTEVGITKEIEIIQKEDQGIDYQYNALFNNRSWFQKNKVWIIGLSLILLIGVGTWYFLIQKSNKIVNSNAQNQSKILEEKRNSENGRNPQVMTKKGSSVIDKFEEWEKYMINHSIFDYVSKEDCQNLKKMMKLYDKGKYPMHLNSKTIIDFDLNDDKVKDYIVSYDLNNCVQGSSATHDFIIISSNQLGGLEINQPLTNSLKLKFLNYTVSTFGEDSYVYKEKEFIVTKGLLPQSVTGGTLFGIFRLEGSGANCCPETVGDFEFDFKSGKFSTSNIRKESY